MSSKDIARPGVSPDMSPQEGHRQIADALMIEAAAKLEEWRDRAKRAERDRDALIRILADMPNALEALADLVAVIDAAGLSNLTSGVQLGQTSWYIKASDRMEAARAVLAMGAAQ